MSSRTDRIRSIIVSNVAVPAGGERYVDQAVSALDISLDASVAILRRHARENHLSSTLVEAALVEAGLVVPEPTPEPEQPQASVADLVSALQEVLNRFA